MKSMFISDNQSPTIVEPGKASLDAAALGVTCCRKARRVTSFSSSFKFTWRNARFDSAPGQLTPENGTVKYFVGDKFCHSASGN